MTKKRTIAALRATGRDRGRSLVSMTGLSKSKSASPKKQKPKQAAKAGRGYWLLQDAKARFSELVRKVRSEGPQHVTVPGATKW